MAIRAGMQYLIDYVRELIYDTDINESNEFYTDQQIQDRLDQHRLDAYALDLTPANTLSQTGSYEWHDFFAPHPFWEEGALVQKISGATLAADEVDYRVGKWTYNTAQSETLVVTGRCYNVYTTCAKLLIQLESELRNQFNFTADALTVQRITQVQDLRALAREYASLGWGGVGGGSQIKLVRRDIRG